MAPYHMDITLAGEKAGSASAIKLVRSIFMKGIASLMIEMLEGAHAYGVAERSGEFPVQNPWTARPLCPI